MLDIYAKSFMTATRTDAVCMREAPSKNTHKRRRWFSLRREICVDPAKL